MRRFRFVIALSVLNRKIFLLMNLLCWFAKSKITVSTIMRILKMFDSYHQILQPLFTRV